MAIKFVNSRYRMLHAVTSDKQKDLGCLSTNEEDDADFAAIREDLPGGAIGGMINGSEVYKKFPPFNHLVA